MRNGKNRKRTSKAGLLKSAAEPRTAETELQLSSAGIQKLRRRIQDMLRSYQAELVKKPVSESERILASLLIDCTDNASHLMDIIEVDATVINNSCVVSKLRALAEVIFGAVTAFLLTTGLFIFLVYMKWNIELSVDAGLIRLLNTAIFISGLAALHSVFRLVYTAASARKKGKITLGVELTVSEEEQKLFIEKQEKTLKEAYETACRQLEKRKAASKLDDENLLMLTDIYQQLYQTQALDDTYNIGGYVIPECRKALDKMGVRIVTEYSAQTAHLFSVIEAPELEKSFVMKPAMVFKDSAVLICSGEYVSAGR